MAFNIPNGWKKISLSQLGEVVGGGTPSTKKVEYYEGGKVPWLTPKDLSGYTSKYISKGERNITALGLKNSSAKLLPEGTVLFSSRAPIGYVAIALNEISTNQGFKSIIPDKDVTTSDFIYYLLIYNTEKIKNISSGSTFKEVSGTVMKNFEVLLPSYKEQIKISKILSSLDDKIETNNAIIANLETQAQAIFNSWFVNFEPFQDGGFVESELGLIPEGWEVRRIGKETDLFTGFPFKSKTYVDEGEFVVITIKNITDGSLVLDSVNYIEEKPANLPSEANLKIGDIVFTMTGNVGRVALVNQDKLLQNQRIGKLILTQEEHRAFYYFLLRNENYKSKIINLAHGTAQANLGKVDFGNILIPFNYEVIDDFSKITEAFLEQIVLLNNQNQKLAQIRDTLLPKLMSGEIRVGQDEVEEIENPL